MANENTGLLIMRLGLAASQLAFAVPRLLRGSPAWTPVGKEIPFFSAAFPDAAVGLAVLAIQILAGAGLLTGYLFRLSCALLASFYALHCLNFLNGGYRTLSMYAGVLACVCLGLALSGPGRYAVALKIESKG